MAQNRTLAEYSILLVEDNQDDVMITKRALTKGSIQKKLYITNDGEEAIKFIRKEGKYKHFPTPALIILDLKMPKVDGFEVLCKIKNTDNLKSIPVIILTSSERDKDIERAYGLGCNSYIVKPVNFEDFIKIVIEIERYWFIVSKVPVG